MEIFSQVAGYLLDKFCNWQSTFLTTKRDDIIIGNILKEIAKRFRRSIPHIPGHNVDFQVLILFLEIIYKSNLLASQISCFVHSIDYNVNKIW